MPLTVLPGNFTSTTDLVRLFHQSQLEWSRHLGEETQLDFGRWISNPALPGCHEANCLHDAYLLPGLSASQLIEMMETKSRQAGVLWRCCTINPSMPAEQTVALAEALLQAGCKANSLHILHRQKIVAINPLPDLNLTIIPARASYRKYRQLLEMRAAEKIRDGSRFSSSASAANLEAEVSHLDDSHLDSLLALRGGQPVGCVGVLTSGEVGTLREWYVADEFRHLGIGHVLLDRALEICSRGLLRHVMIGVSEAAVEALRIVQQAGFEPIGRWSRYVRE